MKLLLIILVLVAGLGVLTNVSYFLDQRAKRLHPSGSTLPKSGTSGCILVWVPRMVVVLLVFSVIGSFVYKSPLLVLLAVGLLALYFVIGKIYRLLFYRNKSNDRHQKE